MDTTSNDTSTIKPKLSTVLTDANQIRSLGLIQMLESSQARLDSLRLEKVRLTAKYGAEAKQTRAVVTRLAASEELRPAMEMDLARAQIATPRADPCAFILYGLVLNQNFGLAASVKIGVVSSGRPIGETETGAKGDFVLTLPVGEGCAATATVGVGDPKGRVTTVEGQLELKAGEVLYREFVI